MLLTEFLVHLKPERDHEAPKSTAKSLLGFLLRLVREVDPGYAKFLHDSNSTKPFTISRLKGKFIKDDGRLLISSEEAYIFRITSASEKLSRILIESISPSFAVKQQVNLWGEFFTIESFSVASEHGYPGLISLAEIERAAEKLSEKYATATVRFVSPTAFRYERRNLLFPQSELLFLSVGRRIKNIFESVYSSENILNDGEVSQINISAYDLKTKVVNFLDIPMQGFVGTVIYDLSKLNEKQLKKAYLSLLLLNYIGVGAKTTMGMGQAFLDIRNKGGIFR